MDLRVTHYFLWSKPTKMIETYDEKDERDAANSFDCCPGL